MPLQATSGAASYDAFGGGVPAVTNYIEDVFSTYLYTGNGPSSQTITNGIDLAGKGGLVWFKRRDSGSPFVHELVDTVQGAGKFLTSNSTSGWGGVASDITSFNANGFSINDNTGLANNGSMCSWTFRKQPKFFDVVTWTGNGASSRTLSHSLNAYPNCVIIKRTNSTSDWWVWHAYAGNYLQLNSTAAENSTGVYSGGSPTTFDIWDAFGVTANVNGSTYVAYLFASDAGGFGLTGTDNVISCGTYTTDGSGNATVNLGWEPQWVMDKVTTRTGDWYMSDVMRQMSQTNDALLYANLSGSEALAGAGFIVPTATGFDVKGHYASQTFIYIAIRRGPMKVPTTGTSVFSVSSGSNNTNPVWTTNFPVDMFIQKGKTSGTTGYTYDRLRGQDYYLQTSSTSAQVNAGGFKLDNHIGVTADTSADRTDRIGWLFKRAPNFFDEVCYAGNGSTGYNLIYHNLGVTPEFVIVKRRDAVGYWTAAGAGKYLILNTTAASTYPTNTDGGTAFGWDSTQFATYGGDGASNVNDVNASGSNYVAYLFATCAGVSKFGTYTGTGTTLQIDCGFTGGARFVLIKRTDLGGAWYVWDSSRGITSGNDPYLLLNTIAAQVTNTDYLNTYSAGFEVTSSAPAAINASGGTYIFLAIA